MAAAGVAVGDQPGCPCSICDEDYMNQSVSRGSAGQSADCNPHPDAPHGFDRTASLNEDRYVCDCESWSETNRADDSLRTRIAAVIMESCHGVYMDDAVAAADAVIRELDLTQQYLVDGIISDGEPRPWELPCETRYATEWEPFHG